QLEDLALRIDGDLLREVALGDGRGDLRDATHLRGQVAGEAVDVVGEILPGAADAADFGLTAELSFGTDFLRDAGNFGGERRERIPHRADGLLQLEDFALRVDGDLLREV